MTGNTNKVRAVFLAALMVFSVFAGTVAFSGSVAAEEPTYDGNAVHYVNESGSSSGSAVVEVPFQGNVEAASLDRDNFTILDDGDNTSSIQNFRQQNSSVILTLNRVYPSNELEVELSENIQSPGGDTITNDGDKTVVFAGQTLEYEGDANGGGTDVQANTNTNVTAYQGVTIAINVSKYNNISRTKVAGGDVPVTVEGEDNNYFQEGSTGVNSSVYTFDTGDREIGEYRVFVNNSDNQANRAFINIRDLQLGIEVDDLNVSTDDTIETTTSAVAGSRDIEADLLDSTGDEINTTQATLDGQGEADIDFDAGSADEGDELDPGTYTVEVTDNATGVTIESSEITVEEADDEETSFASSTIVDQRGDILEATVEMTETSEATVTFGSKDDGVLANATFEDDNGDDQVTFYINTYNLQDDNSNVFALDSDSDDVLLDQTQNNNPAASGANGLGELLDAGDYDLETEAGDNGVTNGVTQSDDVATVTLEERSTENLRMWTGSKEAIGSVSDLEDVNEAIEEGQITRSSEIAVGDFAVHQLEASGFEGALNAREDEDVSSAFSTLNASGPINLTIEEASPGANQDARELDLDYSSNGNVSVIADGPNDTYFVVVDTQSVNYKNGDTLPNDDDTALETNFTVLNRDSPFGQDFVPEDGFDDDENSETLVTFNANEPEVTISEPFNVSQAEGQTVSATTNIAPGTEVRLRVRSDSGVSPSFLKTATPVVGSDGGFSATFDFSQQNVGDTYEITVSSSGIILNSDETEDGTVVESVSTDTATPEPDTDTPTPEPDTDTPTPEPDTDTPTPEPDTDTPMPDTDTPTSTPTSTPGFGVVVALTALLAAALLAIRRD